MYWKYIDLVIVYFTHTKNLIILAHILFKENNNYRKGRQLSEQSASQASVKMLTSCNACKRGHGGMCL